MSIASKQLSATSMLIDRAIKRYAARQPSQAHYDSRGRRDSADTTGIIIGSTGPVDISYCVEMTEVDYTPPDPVVV